MSLIHDHEVSDDFDVRTLGIRAGRWTLCIIIERAR